MRSIYLFLFTVLAMGATLRAQSTLPVVQPIPAQAITSQETALTIDLRNYFSVAGVTGQTVQFDTVIGRFNVELFAHAAPQNAANFLNYVNAGSYADTFFHRSASFNGSTIAIIQGGGYGWTGTANYPVFKFNPVPLEYNLPNERGTLAAARTSDVNSATSEWYFNVTDNSAGLGQANGGGYTVFGRVLGTGMTVVDAIAALPRLNAGGAFSELPVRNYASGTVNTANLASVNSVSVVSIQPGDSPSLLEFTGELTTPSTVEAVISGAMLRLTPIASGPTTMRIRGSDANGNFVEGSFVVTVAAHPLSQAAALSGSVVLNAPTGGAGYQWVRNGLNVTGGTSASLTVANVQPQTTGIYYAFISTNTGIAASRPAIVGVSSPVKVLGTGTEVGSDIVHPNGNIFDQVLLQGSALSVRTNTGQATRTSFIDSNDDIVQVEFSGPGTLSIVMDVPGTSGAPSKYTQPDITYVKGHAGIVINGATEATNVSVFTVGRATAFDITGAYNILQAPSATNNPANNGSPLFVNQGATAYHGVADIAFIAVSSSDGKFGGIRTANTTFHASNGITGIYAPGVQFTGPVFVGDIDASGTATPMLAVGSVLNSRITGGDLQQSNGRTVQVAGLAQLVFAAGSDSHGNLFTAKTNQGVLVQDGVDVTSQIVVNP